MKGKVSDVGGRSGGGSGEVLWECPVHRWTVASGRSIIPGRKLPKWTDTNLTWLRCLVQVRATLLQPS